MADSIQSNSHLHTQATKFSHNPQILAPTSDSKQSNSHLHTQTTKFRPNAQILSSAAYSKESAASNLLRLWVRIPPGAWMSVCCECCVLSGRAASNLLRLWVRIPPGAWKSVCCKCCVLSGRGLCDELITLPEESYRSWLVNVSDLENP